MTGFDMARRRPVGTVYAMTSVASADMRNAAREERYGRSAGMTLVELLAVLAVLGISLAFVSLGFGRMGTPLDTGVALVEAKLRQARAQAIVTTSACRVRPDGSAALIIETADRCSSGSWTANSGADGRVELADGVSLSDPTWTVCFNSRGVSSAAQVLELIGPQRETGRIEVLRGGTTRVLP